MNFEIIMTAIIMALIICGVVISISYTSMVLAVIAFIALLAISVLIGGRIVAKLDKEKQDDK